MPRTPKMSRPARKIPLKVIFLCFLIALSLGIGMGRLTQSGQIHSQNSEISTLASEATEFQSKYDALVRQQSDLSSQLQDLQARYDLLSQENREGTPGLVSALKEQLSALAADKTKLNTQLSDLQIENAKLKSSLEAATASNSSLTERIGKAEADMGRLTIQVAQLTKQFTPSPDHAMNPSTVFGAASFKSDAWLGRDFQLQSKIEEIGRLYNKSHTYITGETDCNDMAVDLWNMLLTENIKSVIVIGNLEKTGEAFTESNHGWLDIFDAEGRVIYLEPTTGEVFYGRLANGSSNPKVVPYREGWIYEKPSSLWSDLKKMW